MKKIALFAMALCACFISNAQNNFDTIHSGDPRYFPSDSLDYLSGGGGLRGCNVSLGRVYTFEESDSMKVWGMACSFDSITPDRKCGVKMFLFKLDDDFDTTGQLNLMFDSVTLVADLEVDINTPSRHLAFSSGAPITMYEAYFDTAIMLVGTYGVCWGNEIASESSISLYCAPTFSCHRNIIIHVDAEHFNPSGKSWAQLGKGIGTEFFEPVYLITDSSLRDDRIQPPAESCPPVGLLSIDSLGARCVRLSWTDSVDRCYYELAIGPVSSPVDSLTFYITTDTSFFFDHLPPGVPYKAFVRGVCDCDGDTSPWGNLVAFTYSPYHLNLSANNPEWGTVYGGGEYYGETQLEISASPANERCSFDGWDDGCYDNPRSIFLCSDTSFTAIFSFDSTGIGISAPANFGLSVSPNPVRHSLKVRTSVDVQGSLEVFNAEGQRLMVEAIAGQEARLDVSRLSSGQYLLHLKDRRASATAKFVKR